jgi:hypothetical protein
MSRGLPAVWSAAFGAPFVAVGTYVVGFQSRFPLVADQPTAPRMAGVPLALFGLFVVGLGLYAQFVGMPPRPAMGDGEWVVDERDPAQRSALVRAFASVPFLAVGLDLLYFTRQPLVYPTLALGCGFYLFSTGVHEYWRNTLTSYLLTNRRVLEEYRFVSLVRSEVPLEKVRAVEERRSALDTLLGLGNVHVRAGGTGDLSVTVRSVYESTEFADAVREELDHTRTDPCVGSSVLETADHSDATDAAEAAPEVTPTSTAAAAPAADSSAAIPAEPPVDDGTAERASASESRTDDQS